MSNFSTRLAFKEDIHGMHAVEKSSFRTPWSYEAFEENFFNLYSVYVLAETEDKIIGFGGMQVIFDEAHVMNVAVLSDFRRQGVADSMLKLMQKEAKERGASIMFLEVRSSNAPARALYEKNGFTAAGVRKKYYSDNGEDAIIMTCAL